LEKKRKLLLLLLCRGVKHVIIVVGLSHVYLSHAMLLLFISGDDIHHI